MAKLSKKISLLSATVVTMVGFVPAVSHFVNLNNKLAQNANISKSFFASSTPNESNKNYYAVEKFNTISNVNGPVTLADNGKSIQGYDWYGNINWKIDVSTIDIQSTKIVDWEFMPTRNWIYIITDKSYVLKINGFNGEILARKSFAKDKIQNKAVSVPDNPNKFASIEFNNSLYIWNTSTKTPSAVRVDRNTLEPQAEKDNAQIKFNESDRYLVKIFSLFPGYNLALHASSAPNDSSALNDLKLTFVDDNFKKISSSNETSINVTKNGSSSNINSENLSAYIFNRSLYKKGNSILIIGNKLYEVNLNKSQMNQSTVKELKYQKTPTNNKYPNVVNEQSGKNAQANDVLLLKTVNSAFMDNQDNIYFKEKDGSKIYSLDFNNNLTLFFDLAKQTINSDIKKIVSTTNGSNITDKNNNLQIFGVPSAQSLNLAEKNTNTNIRNTMFLSNTETSYITVINDSRIDNRNFKSEGLTPKLILKNSRATAFKDNIPSVIDTSYFETKAADVLDGSKVKFKADDLKGELAVTATLTKPAWYSNDSDIKTSSIVKLNYPTSNVKNKKISEQVQWASDNTFKSWFGKYTPQQLVESDLEKQTDLIKIKNSSNANNFKNLTKKIAIKNRDNNTGKITISGVISYTNRHNNYVNFIIPEKIYTIAKNTGKYAFRFVGETTDNAGVTNGNEFSEEQLKSTISIDTIRDEKVNELKIFVPSMIKPSDLSFFIDKEESYLPSRRTITKIANDEKGTLTLMVMYNGLDPTKPYKFIKTFTGFQSYTTARINFKGDSESNQVIADQFKNDTYKNPKNITVLNGPQKDYSKETAKDVEASELFNIYDTSLTKMGFIPAISINPLTSKDHEYGSIVVCLDYSPIENGSDDENEKKLKFPYKDKFGLKDYKIYQRYTGLLPIGETYRIELDEEKKMQLMQTYNVDASIDKETLLNTIRFIGYKKSEITVLDSNWDGLVLKYIVAAQSEEYESVSTRKMFTIDWTEKFEKIRIKNLILAVTISLLGVALVSVGIGVYAIRRHSIRRKMK